MEPMLVITNSEAGSTDNRNLEPGLSVLRAGASVTVEATSFLPA